MPSAHGLCVFFCIVLSVIRETEGVITSPPLNAAAEVSGEAVFTCSASSVPYAWSLTRDGNGLNGEIEITAGCVVSPALENHYRTEQPVGTTTCSLIVFDITMEQAGVYHCVHSDVFRVLLTVIDSSSTLTSNDTQDVIETETVVITCSINYNGSVSPAPTLRPHYYWTDVNGQNVSGFVNKSTENKAVSELSVKAGRQDITPFTCHVYLKLDPPDTSGYANNTPTVNNNANSPPIAVLYGIGPVSIKNSTVDGDVILTCTTTGNPEPNYYWTSSNDIANRTVPTIQTKVVGYFECNATNVIRNYTYSNASELNVTKDYFPPTTPSPSTPNPISHSSIIPSPAITPKQPDAETTYIVALAVGLSVYEIANLIAMGVFLAYYTYNVDTDANTNGNNSKVGLNKRAFNGRFPWLEKMLPCMNKSNDKLSANCGRDCLWIFIFSLLTISCGIFVFPILMIIVMCGGMDLHRSQDNSQLNLRIDEISVSMKTVNQFHPTPTSPPQRPAPPPNRPTRPPPPPTANTHQNTGEGGAIEYAILPCTGRPHLAPAQYLDDDRMFHYAILRRV